MMNEDTESVKKAVEALKEEGIIFQDDKSLLFHRDGIADLKEKICRTVKEYHTANPLKMGVNKEELLIKTGAGTDIFTLVIRMLVNEKRLEISGDIVKDAGFNLSVSGSEEIFSKNRKGFS